jgi:hypothetical protein
MADEFVVLECGVCHSRLSIYGEMEQLACYSCGSKLLVDRSGDIPVLKVLEINPVAATSSPGTATNRKRARTSAWTPQLTAAAVVVLVGVLAYAERAEILKLFQHQTDLDALEKAAANGDIQAVQRELSKSLDQTAFEGRQPWSPLHWAAAAGHEQIIRMFLDKGIKPDLRDGKGETPLMLAAGKGNLAAMQVLLQRGADPNATDSGNVSALRFACAGEQAAAAIRLLGKAGAEMNDAPGGISSDSLGGAILGGRTEIVRALIESGARVGIMEALMASKKGNKDIQKLIATACSTCARVAK